MPTFVAAVPLPIVTAPVVELEADVVAVKLLLEPPKVDAPVEVLKAPVLPEKSFAPDPDAVRPPEMTGVVRVHDTIVPVAPAAKT